MSEAKEKMKGLVYKLERKGKARLNKLMQIKGKFKAKFESISQNSPFNLDFNAFKSIQEAKNELLNKVFSNPKKKSESGQTNTTVNNIFI